LASDTDRVCEKAIQDVADLRLMSTRAGFQHSVVDEAIDQWRQTPDGCIFAQGARTSFRTVSLTLHVACFMTALNDSDISGTTVDSVN